MSTKKAKSVPMACKTGQTRPNTRENGLATKRTAKVSFGVQMATLTKVTGKTTKQTDLATSSRKMGRSATSEIGRMICTMAREWKAGLMAPVLTDIFRKAKRTDSALTFGLMELSTLEIGKTIRCRDKARTNGLMEENTRENGSKVTCMDEVSTLGLMAGCMKGTIQVTSDTVWVRLSGQMAACTLASGRMARCTAKAPISMQINRKRTGSGLKDRGLC